MKHLYELIWINYSVVGSRLKKHAKIIEKETIDTEYQGEAD